jgi:hypothetical protein
MIKTINSKNIFNSKSYWIVSMLAIFTILIAMLGFQFTYRLLFAMAIAPLSVYFSFVLSDFFNRKRGNQPIKKPRENSKKMASERAKQKLSELLKGRF